MPSFVAHLVGQMGAAVKRLKSMHERDAAVLTTLYETDLLGTNEKLHTALIKEQERRAKEEEATAAAMAAERAAFALGDMFGEDEEKEQPTTQLSPGGRIRRLSVGVKDMSANRSRAHEPKQAPFKDASSHAEGLLADNKGGNAAEGGSAATPARMDTHKLTDATAASRNRKAAPTSSANRGTMKPFGRGGSWLPFGRGKAGPNGAGGKKHRA